MSSTLATPSDTGETPDPAPVPAGGRAWLTSARFALSTWAAAASAYLLVNVFYWMTTDKPGPPVGHMLDVWNRWDTGHYLRIAEFGYTADRPDTAAFYPLYPLLLRVFDPVLPGGLLTAALVVSNLCCIGGLMVLHRLATVELGEAAAARVPLYLMAFPAAFFLSAGYSSSLFLLLSVACLYCARRHLWWAAGGIGALATATRFTGLLLMLAVGVEYLRHRGWSWRAVRPDAAAIALIPAGLVAFAGYCWWHLGDPLAFTHAQTLWGRELAPPWAGLAEAIGAVVTRPLLVPMALHNAIDAVTLLVMGTLLVLSMFGPWRLRRDQAYLVVYAVAGYLLVLTGPVGGLFPMQGAPRYALELIPAFLVLAKMGESRHAERLYLLPAMAVQVMFLLTYFTSVWIA